MARRLTGRLLRGSALVGTDSGPGSDSVTGWLMSFEFAWRSSDLGVEEW